MRSALLVLAFSFLASTGCADPPAPLGGYCAELGGDGCDDGLACEPIGPFADPGTCTKTCRNPGPDLNRPDGVPAACGDDAVCVATPSGLDSCLALCTDDGSCEYGQAGYPFLDAPEMCVCIPWRE